MRSVAEMMNLFGRKALVTGGAGHIGRAVGESLLEVGATLSVLDLNPESCEDAADDLRRTGGGSVFAIPCDLTNEMETRDAIHLAVAKMGGLDILVHCAAYIGDTRIPGWAVPFEEQTVGAWDAAIRVSLTSAFILAQEAREPLSVSGCGSVILFASIYGMAGPDFSLYEGTDMANPGGYAASKGGIIQITKYLATAMAPRVRVNAISPGGVWRNQPDLFHQRYVAKTPLGRMATEEDLKGAVTYLASDLSSYVTGHNLVVDGGWTTW